MSGQEQQTSRLVKYQSFLIHDILKLWRSNRKPTWVCGTANIIRLSLFVGTHITRNPVQLAVAHTSVVLFLSFITNKDKKAHFLSKLFDSFNYHQHSIFFHLRNFKHILHIKHWMWYIVLGRHFFSFIFRFFMEHQE